MIIIIKMNKEIIIELIQNSLIGELDSSSNFKPQFLADAIIKKLNLNRTLKETNAKKIDEIVNSFNDMINDIDKDMNIEYEQLGADEVLLKNFVRGQKTTCEKLRESLKNI